MPLSVSELHAETNIAEQLKEDELNKIGDDVVEGYETDKSSRAEWESRLEDALKLAAQVVEDKTFPWEDAANVKYPLLTTAALQFASRAYPALVPGPNLVKGRVVGYDPTGEKMERAIRIGKHMSYQLMEEMEDWEEDMDKLCIIIPIVGCAFKKTYFSSVKARNISELVLAQNLVVDYYAKSLEDATRITHELYLTKRDVRERQLAGSYLDIDLELPTAPDKKPDTNDIAGLTDSGDEHSTPYTILESHCYLDLDDDGYSEPYIVTVCKESKKVLRISPRWDVDGIVVEDNRVVYIEPVHYFTKFSFIPNPDGGFYDIGFGTLLGPINNTIDSSINQLLDAGTLNNMPSGFLGRGIRLRGGNYKFSPGEWKFVNSTGDDLRKGIVPLPVNEPSAVVFNLLGMMVQSGERLASTVDSLVGENPGQNQKATTTVAVIEQGMKVFSGIYKRLYRSLKKEMKKLYRLNSIYLLEEDYFIILDPMLERGANIKRKDYELKDADVIPAADPTVATEQQKLAKAQGLLELLAVGTVNPMEVTKRVLEAQEQAGVELLMQMPEPQPSMEEMQAQDESQRKWAEIQLRGLEVQAKVLESRAKSILALAQAEGVEQGQQLELYKTQLDAIRQEEERVQQQAQQMMQQQQGQQQGGGEPQQ
jgi:chaperonin GroES